MKPILPGGSRIRKSSMNFFGTALKIDRRIDTGLKRSAMKLSTITKLKMKRK